LNPLVYGLGYKELKEDIYLTKYLNDIIYLAATKLDRNRMIVFDSVNGYLSSTDLGRIASHFYITFETIETVNSNEGKVQLTASSTTDIVLAMICKASEFQQIKARGLD
jgi:replicative superfamily II helicase